MARANKKKLKNDATAKTVEVAMLFPILLLREKKRIVEFTESFDELWATYKKEFITLEGITNQLELKIDLKYKGVADG